MLIAFITAAVVILADQLTKYLAVSALAPDKSVDVIKGIFRFTYVENRGAAFGSFADNRWVFLILSTALILAIAGYVVWKRPKGLLECLSMGMLIGGGIGNMIDRIALGYVVDFLDFCAFPNLWMWVFNVADAFVCIGTGLLVIWMLTTDMDPKDKKTPVEASDDCSDVDDTKGGNDNDEAE